MTSKDIARFFERNAERLEQVEKEQHRVMRKWCLRNHKRTMAKSVIRNVEGTCMAFLCRYELRGAGLICYKYAYIKETNEWVCKMYGKKQCFAVTPHWLRRYGERVLGKQDEPSKVLMQFVKRNDSSAVVYANGNNLVRACRDGITLGRYDESRDMEVFKTFVGLDMLKRTQRAAYDAVQSLFAEEGFSVSDTVQRHQEISQSWNWNDNLVVFSQCAKAFDAYAEYFEKDMD